MPPGRSTHSISNGSCAVRQGAVIAAMHQEVLPVGAVPEQSTTLCRKSLYQQSLVLGTPLYTSAHYSPNIFLKEARTNSWDDGANGVAPPCVSPKDDGAVAQDGVLVRLIHSLHSPGPFADCSWVKQLLVQLQAASWCAVWLEPSNHQRLPLEAVP
jgi:hypothetical protein